MPEYKEQSLKDIDWRSSGSILDAQYAKLTAHTTDMIWFVKGVLYARRELSRGLDDPNIKDSITELARERAKLDIIITVMDFVLGFRSHESVVNELLKPSAEIIDRLPFDMSRMHD